MRRPRKPMVPKTQPRRAAGELEADVLAALWSADTGLTPGDVKIALGTDHAYNTVLTILLRLHDKGLVEREKVGRAYAYRATMDEADMAAERMRSVLDSRTDRSGVLQRFVAGLSAEDERVLRKLMRGS